MIIGIGTDIVDINRFKTTFMHERRVEKIFTDLEIAYAKDKFDPFVHYAGMWAAREAYIKANGNPDIAMADVSVAHSKDGAPYILFMGEIITPERVFLSISHDGNYAAATVVIEAI